ncbi:MAG: helix-turn-helix transcriptional regulator, partial [Actinobacteria bacterium]|nr:helix-turn-helix transcriptional regulator [Actinomycetota bacterium]
MIGASALRLAEIAAGSGDLPERAEALLLELRRHVPFDASWLALADPLGTGYTSLASTSLDEGTVRYLSGPKMAHDIEVTGTHRNRPPLSPSELPYPAEELPTWAECLHPAGYHEALAVPLFAPGSRHVGFLALLSTERQPPTPAMRRRLRRLTPIVASGIDPMRSMLTAAGLVQGAWAGVVLGRRGVLPLPGMGDDVLLGENSPVLVAGRAAITNGQVYASFLWPLGGRYAPDGHVRVTVLAATADVGGALLGVVLLSAAGDLRRLTHRELEVLGLLIEGRTNSEIAQALVVA